MQAPPDWSETTRAWLAEGRHYSIDGRQVFCVDRGSGRAICFLHGFPTSAFDWREIIALLADEFRCLAPDLPGYGLSDKPVAYSYSLFQQADTIEGLWQALGLSELHLVSHDMGTSVHCELLARQQEGRLAARIVSSTLLNGSMLQWLAAITPFQELLASNATLPQAIELCQTAPQVYVPGLLAIMRHPERIDPAMQQTMVELLCHQEGHMRLPALAGYMRERYIARDRWLGALGAAQGPVQFVWADGDPIANQALGRELARMFPSHRYVELADLGHFLLMEDPVRVAAEVRPWVRRHG